MQSFSIRNIEILTGIKAHTLRIWEQRYEFFKASRKQSNQRIYSNEDLQHLLCVAFLYHNGWKISRIAAMSEEEVRQAVDEIPVGQENYQAYLQKLLRAAIAFNEAAFVHTLNDVTAAIGFEKTITALCYPFLQKVGLLWDTNRVIPAQEHFSSYIIQNRLISETEKFSSGQEGTPELVLFCPENEYHELPLLYLNYLLRKAGWRVLYLGKNVSLDSLAEAASLPGVRYLYLHLITNFTGLFVDDYLEQLRKKFPDKIILASGRSIESSQRTFLNLRLLRRDEEIHQFIERRVQLLGST